MKPKFTGGNWKVGNYGWCVVTDDKDAIDLEKRDTAESVSYYGGALICESCRTDDAKLIAEAGNVANVTGLSPKELLQQRNELLKCLNVDLLICAAEVLELYAKKSNSTSIISKDIEILAGQMKAAIKKANGE